MNIRRYQSADFDPVTILWRMSREKSLPDFQRQKGHFFYEDREYFKSHILQKDEVWVWEEHGIPLAFLAIRDDFIDHLYVHPDAWWQGIGTKLLHFARTLSPDHLWLYTLQINTKARSFYERHGFVAVKFGVSPAPESEPDVEYHWYPAPE